MPPITHRLYLRDLRALTLLRAYIERDGATNARGDSQHRDDVTTATVR